MMHVHATETPFNPEAPQPLLREIADGADYPVQRLDRWPMLSKPCRA